ncbi:hypothetical protein AVEN_82857-1 [Araneus ventricosus]|uniref:Uncharacterized protein n=1 Tax=Araneus ventricosus TaxID=182803 RepID=A0A4Y2F5K8_ARAVE|nr:hypothetical protein AVEN_82857-1 [Araneus ventricosus]
MISINRAEHVASTVGLSFDIGTSNENLSAPDGNQTQVSDKRSDCAINKKESNSDNNNDAYQPDAVNSHLQNSHESLYSIPDILFRGSSSSLETDRSRKTGVAITIFMWILILMFLGFELLQASEGYNWIPHSYIHFLIAFVLWIAIFKLLAAWPGVARAISNEKFTPSSELNSSIRFFSGGEVK